MQELVQRCTTLNFRANLHPADVILPEKLRKEKKIKIIHLKKKLDWHEGTVIKEGQALGNKEIKQNNYFNLSIYLMAL